MGPTAAPLATHSASRVLTRLHSGCLTCAAGRVPVGWVPPIGVGSRPFACLSPNSAHVTASASLGWGAYAAMYATCEGSWPTSLGEPKATCVNCGARRTRQGPASDVPTTPTSALHTAHSTCCRTPELSPFIWNTNSVVLGARRGRSPSPARAVCERRRVIVALRPARLLRLAAHQARLLRATSHRGVPNGVSSPRSPPARASPSSRAQSPRRPAPAARGCRSRSRPPPPTSKSWHPPHCAARQRRSRYCWPAPRQRHDKLADDPHA